MAYIGHRLEPFFDTTPVRRVCVRMAEHGGDRITALTKANTPIGHRPFDDDYVPGKLRASIEKKMLVIYRRGSTLVYETGCESNLDYAPYVEEGTGIWPGGRGMYVIRPKRPDGWLSWIDQKTGERVFAKEVHHPGSPGQHMFKIGAHLAEYEFGIFGQREAHQWAREQERQAMRQRPVYWGRRV